MSTFHCKRIWIVVSVTLVFLLLTPTAFAQNDTPSAAVDTVIKFNGVYQAVSYLGQGRYFYYYYRFFPNGTVSSYSSPFTERVSDVYKALEIAPSGSGNYSVQNGEIKFSLTFPKGNVDYTGTMVEDKLRLVFHSYIINTDGSYNCQFIKVLDENKKRQ